MTGPYRTFIILGAAVGLLGAGYVFVPQPGAATVAAVPVLAAAPLVSAVHPAAPATKPVSTLVANRAPVPVVTRKHTIFFVPKEADTSIQTVSATTGISVDGGLPPPAPGDAQPDDSSQAKAAIELDGYKNVRGLAKGPDGVWRGRAMRGRTEIAIRVDATGSVSAD